MPEPTTALLCIICILVTLANSTTRPEDPGPWAHLGHFTDPDTQAVLRGHYSLLFTSMFLHENFTRGLGVTHLFFDVYWLYLLGNTIEKSIGPVWYMLFVAAAALVGSCVEIVWSDQVGIGASGVVYALFGLMWAGRFRYDEWRDIANPYNMRMMLAWGVFCVVTTYTHLMSIANGAHFGGLAFGLCVGFLCFARTRRWLWTLPLCAIVALCTLSITYMPWSPSWLWWKATNAFQAQNYAKSADLYQRYLQRGGDDRDDAWHNIGAAWHNKSIDDQAKGDHAAVEIDGQNEAAAAAKSGGAYTLDN